MPRLKLRKSLLYILFSYLSLIIVVLLLVACIPKKPPRAELLDIAPGVLESQTQASILGEHKLLAAHISDLHHYAPELYDPESEAFAEFARNNEGRTVRYTTELMAQLKRELLALGVEYLFLSGDLTIFGIPASHRDAARILADFEAAGIEVCVTTGNHDLNHPKAFTLQSGEMSEAESVTPDQFREIYRNFGFSQATMIDETSLSYYLLLNEEYALLSLDSSVYEYNYEYDFSAPTGRMRPGQYEFTARALSHAEATGREVIVMTHHNFLDHYEIDYDLSVFKINDEEELLRQLMDEGVKLGISGHIHKSDIKSRTDEKGRDFYGITTAPISLYPHAYRLIGLDPGSISLSSRELDFAEGSEEEQAILTYSRNIGLMRNYRRQVESLVKKYSRDEAETMAAYFYLANLYAQQGLEASIPPGALSTRGRELWENADSQLSAFALILDLDSPPDDRNLRIEY